MAGSPYAVMTNVANVAGGVSDIKMGPNITKEYMEVKSGLSASSIPEGVDQAIKTAGAINQAGLGGTAISSLVVDAGAWESLSSKQRSALVAKAQSGGAYIRVEPGLADAARKRAQKMVDETKKKEQKQH